MGLHLTHLQEFGYRRSKVAEIKWTVSQLERTTTDGGVITAHWRCTATDNTGEEPISAGCYGSCSFEPDPTSESFIPFDQLTEEIVLGWVYGLVDKEVMEQNCNEKLDKLLNPERVAGLPW